MTMIGTDRSRVKDAIRFKQANGTSTWAVLGKTTPWDNEAEPPVPLSSMTSLDDAVVAVKASVYWVKEDDAGSFQFNDINGDLVSYSAFATKQDAIDAGSTLVLLQASTLGANLSVSSYREIGFVTDLVPAAGHESDTILEAADVDDWGDLELVDFKIKKEVDTSIVYVLAGIKQY